MFEWIADPQAWMALATLTALEIVLGIDNIIFIAILVNKLPPHLREKARVMGLGFAMITRIGLLLSLAWVMGLTDPVMTLLGEEISGRDIILIVGGAFLLYKATAEIHGALEGEHEQEKKPSAAQVGFTTIILQIAVIDIVFSLDSVITAVGMADHIPVMVIAVVLAVLVMMFAARSISEFVDNHPTIKMLALSFLLMVGTALIAEGLDFHIPKGYIYFAMAFSVGVEMLNIRIRGRSAHPVHLQKAPLEQEAAAEAERRD